MDELKTPVQEVHGCEMDGGVIDAAGNLLTPGVLAGWINGLAAQVAACQAEVLDDNARSHIRTMADDPLNYPAGDLQQALLTLLEENANLRRSAVAHDVHLRGALRAALQHVERMAHLARPTEFAHGALGTVRDQGEIAKTEIETALATSTSPTVQRGIEAIGKVARDLEFKAWDLDDCFGDTIDHGDVLKDWATQLRVAVVEIGGGPDTGAEGGGPREVRS